MAEVKVDLLKNSSFEDKMDELINAVADGKNTSFAPQYASGIKIGTLTTKDGDTDVYVPATAVGTGPLETLTDLIGAGGSSGAVQSNYFANDDDVTFRVYASEPNLGFTYQMGEGGVLTIDIGAPAERPTTITVEVYAVDTTS